MRMHVCGFYQGGEASTAKLLQKYRYKNGECNFAAHMHEFLLTCD